MLYIVIRKPKAKYLGVMREGVCIVEAESVADALRKCPERLTAKSADYTRPQAELLKLGEDYWL